jgi:hypothetical protein
MRNKVDHSMSCSLVLLGLVFILSGGNLQAQQEKREATGFNSISFSLAGNLEIAQGTTEELMLKGDQADLAKIVTNVEDGELKIYCKEHSGNMGDVLVFVNVKELKELAIAGSGNVIFKTPLHTTEMEISLSGSGNIECLDLTATKSKINLSGSGDIKIGGVVSESSEINIAGSGDVNAENLKTKISEVNLSGSGSAKVWAEDQMESNIVGSGNVLYKGKPLVESNISGSGSTKHL